MRTKYFFICLKFSTLVLEIDSKLILLQAKDCMLFAGTGLASGNCIGVVNSTGMTTEIGKIQIQIKVVLFCICLC